MKPKTIFAGSLFLALVMMPYANGQIRSAVPLETRMPRPQPLPSPTAPYPMTYSDEAAQTLGLKDGRLDVFTVKPAKNGILPDLSGGVGPDGAKIKLQWHPGE